MDAVTVIENTAVSFLVETRFPFFIPPTHLGTEVVVGVGLTGRQAAIDFTGNVQNGFTLVLSGPENSLWIIIA